MTESTIFTAQNRDDISNLYKKASPDDEFEFIFYNYNESVERMSLQGYLKILEFFKYRQMKNKLKFTNTNTIDVVYSEREESFRISINDLAITNNIMESVHDRSNHIIFSMLTGASQNKNSLIHQHISIINKKRNIVESVNLDDYNIRVKLSKELAVTKKDLERLETLSYECQNDIVFRYKQRSTLYILNDDTGIIKIDLTNTKMSRNINTLESSTPIYELEIDCTIKKHGKHIDTILKEAEVLLKILQQSNYIVSTSTTKAVIGYYFDIMGVSKDSLSLSIRKPESLEVQHIIEKLPNRYAVTDKADGDRYILVVYNLRAYLISDNLRVIDTGIVLTNQKYNGTILDGEYVFIKRENRYVYLVFDCIYYDNINSNQINSFMARLQYADEIVSGGFGVKNVFKRYSGDFNSKKILSYYENEIRRYIDELNKLIKVNKRFPIVITKMFLPVLGIEDNEIFKYSALVWKSLLQDPSIKCPYILDGMMFHPLNQEYVISKDTKLLDYKWKPQDKNSIDFYIEFEKDGDGNQYVVYDNSSTKNITNKPYKICNLFVGKIDKGNEQPVQFMKEQGKGVAYLFIDNGEIRDIEGNIIRSETVVEFYYNNDPSVDEKHRWVPIRTRYDKTEHVMRNGKKYGNYYSVANKVWRSISSPINIADFIKLANDNAYSTNIEAMRERVDRSVVLAGSQDAYYQLTTAIAKPLRAYQNWMKSLIIYTFCNPLYEDKNKKNILDIGCGRGGDIMKFYYNNVTNILIGIDKDNNGLIAPTDGAIDRYELWRKKKADFPFMGFINADASVKLVLEDQLKLFPSMTRANMELIRKFLNVDGNRVYFDRVNCQMAIHYFLENNLTWSNFLGNINNYLAPGGMMLITTFDATRIIELLKDKSNYIANYNTDQGEQKVLFDIVKRYSDDQISNIKTNGIGIAIDFFTSMFQNDGTHATEYLVDKDFLQKEFLEKCDMELIESDLFENQYHIHEDYVTKFGKFEENKATLKFLTSVLSFYKNKDELTKASYDLMKLYRYYVFRKKDDSTLGQPTKSRQQKRPSSKINFRGSTVRSVPSKKKFEVPYIGDIDTIDFTAL